MKNSFAGKPLTLLFNYLGDYETRVTASRSQCFGIVRCHTSEAIPQDLELKIVTRSSPQKSILTGSSSAGRSRVLRRSPSFHIEGAHSHKVMHAL